MSDAGWRAARLREIPASSEAPGVSVEEYRQAMAERAPHLLERRAEPGSLGRSCTPCNATRIERLL